MTCWHFIRSRSMLGSKGSPCLVFMGSFDFKWTYGPSFWWTVRKEERIQASLDCFCDGDSSLFHRFSPPNAGAGHSGNRDLCRRLCLCNGGSPDSTKYVERVFALRKTVLSILSFSICPHALTGHHRLDLDRAAPFWDCQLSIGLFRK